MPIFWIINIVAVIACSIILSGVMIPKILLISFRKKLFDIPDERKMHHSLVPRLGGIAFKPVIFFSIAFAIGIDIITGYGDIIKNIDCNIPELLFLYCSVLTLYIIGIADDLIGVRYRAKFVVQIACAIMFIAGDIWVNNLHGILGLWELSPYIGYPLTILLVVFIANAINLIDGIDGLASGLSSIALFIYGIAFILLHQYLHAMLAFATWGVLIPFFYYNVFGKAEHGRKIFMGDTGSLTIGIILGFLSIKLISFESTDSNALMSDSRIMVTAFSPLIIPCFDVVRVFIHRIRRKNNPFLPDKSHIHHKLMAIGLPQRAAMITIVSVAAVFSISNIILSPYMNINILVIADIILWTLINMWLTKQIHKRQIEY